MDVGDPESVDVGELESVPPPAVTATVTGTPPRIFPPASFTENVGELPRTRPAVADGVFDAAAIEAGTAGSVPLLQPEITRAIAADSSNRRRTLIILAICTHAITTTTERQSVCGQATASSLFSPVNSS
jgi:hypothetical protein